MIATFTNEGTRYELVVLPAARRESEERADVLQLDPTLWTSKQKQQAMNHRYEEVGKVRGDRRHYKKRQKEI